MAARSSAEKVKKIVRIARELSIETATPAEARKIPGFALPDTDLISLDTPRPLIHHRTMVKMTLTAAVLACAVSCTSCVMPSPPPIQEESGEESHTAPDSHNAVEPDSNGQQKGTGADDIASRQCDFIDEAGNHLDYRDPSLFLNAGPQSRLSTSNADSIKNRIDGSTDSLDTITAVFDWKHSHFDTDNAGGAYVGTLTVDDIMERGALSGCHDHGIVLASVFRLFDVPTVMVDAAGIQWASDYSAGRTERFVGHVFLEVWTGTGWILLDSTSGEYLVDYNPCEPFIPLTKSIESLGYYALLKGLDPAGYGVHGIEDLKRHMALFSAHVETKDLECPEYEQHRLQA